MLSLPWQEGRQSFREVSRYELPCVHLAFQCAVAACVHPALPLEEVFFGEGRKKNAFKESVDELTARL